MTGVRGWVFIREGAIQGVDSTLTRSGQIFGDGGLQNGVRGVEVAVCEVVFSHPGDLSPRDSGLGRQQVFGEGSDGLSDFQQADRTALNTRPSDRSPRCRWERIASIAAWMSASRWCSR